MSLLSTIPVYCPGESQLATLASAGGGRLEVLPFRDWRAFYRVRLRAACSVVIIEQLRGDRAYAHLSGAAGHRWMHPTVLVTSSDAENVRLIGGLPVWEVVWCDELRDALVPAVERARAGGHLHRTAAAVDGAARIPARLRGALAHACRAPVASVRELAERAGCDRSTLVRQWRKTASAPGPRLEDFVDWLILLRAAAGKGPGRKWSVVAQELGTGERTLGRIAQRLAGSRLREIEGCAYAELAQVFDRGVVAPLVAPSLS